MNAIGFPISHKENERRRALVPDDVRKVFAPEYLVFEHGYGDVLGYSDEDYLSCGARIASRDKVLEQPIICDPKIGDADYVGQLKMQKLFGWMHIDLHRELANVVQQNKLTVYGWEEMFEGGRHVFWRNNEIAGEAAIAHAFLCHGIFPYSTKVALIGRGNVARGVLHAMYSAGVEIKQYDRRSEDLLRKELPEFDVIVNAVMWDQLRTDHIIYRKDLHRMKRGSMIVDVSCDRAGAIETSRPTTIENPLYYVDGIAHYAVDHTPALFYKSTSLAISCELPKYINALIRGFWNGNKEALLAEKGCIVNETIRGFLHLS